MLFVSRYIVVAVIVISIIIIIIIIIYNQFVHRVQNKKEKITWLIDNLQCS